MVCNVTEMHNDTVYKRKNKHCLNILFENTDTLCQRCVLIMSTSTWTFTARSFGPNLFSNRGVSLSVHLNPGLDNCRKQGT